MQNKMNSDSHKARHGIQECNFCLKTRTEAGKLFACSGCKLALYCSSDCQKSGWAFHKTVCKSIREERLQLKEIDKCFSVGGAQPSTNASAIPPSVIMDKFCAFTEKFKLPLMEAGYNALRITTEPDFSADVILFVMLDHVPERVQSPRQWAHFRVLY